MLHFFLKLACREEVADFIPAEEEEEAEAEADAVEPGALVVLLLMLCTMRLRQSKLEPFGLLSKSASSERERGRRRVNWRERVECVYRSYLQIARTSPCACCRSSVYPRGRHQHRSSAKRETERKEELED